jgi:hypothetical protein
MRFTVKWVHISNSKLFKRARPTKFRHL